MLNTINVNLNTDLKVTIVPELGIKIKSQDINNNLFILRFTDKGKAIELDETYTVEILTKFEKSKSHSLTSATVYRDYARWEFDTSFITMDEKVTNYVYVRKSGSLVVSADANAFAFDVGLSEIDKDAGRVAEVYDENYEKYLDEFKDNVNFEEIAQAESDRQANEDIRQANELLREENYNQKVDTAIVEADVVAKVDNKVTELTPQINQLTAQLAQTENRIDLVSDFNRIGKIKLPDDFPKTLPFDLYRDNDGIVKHTMNLDELEIGAGHIHIKTDQGSSADSNDGLTEATAVRLISDAITKANALPQSTVVIHFYDDSVDVSRFGGIFTYTLSKNLIFKSHAPTGRTAFFSGYRMNTKPWTLEGSAYTTPAVPFSRNIAFDGKFKDYRGTPRKMKVVNSASEVNNTPNSIYYATDKTYIHTLDSREPDSRIMLLQSSSQQLIFNTNGYRLVIRGCHFVWYGGGNSLRINGLGTNANDRSEFWYENCVFTQAKTNGLQVNGVYETYGFNSTAYDVPSDGFNYHALSVSDAGNEFVFEYQCEAFDCGNVGDSTMNATTAHEGMTVLRVGSVGYRTYGPVCADVNGCFSVNIDCNMYDSLRPTYRTRAGFFFDKSGEKVGLGKTYLLNCSGGGKDTWTFNSDGSIEITIQKITGNNIPTDIPYTVL